MVKLVPHDIRFFATPAELREDSQAGQPVGPMAWARKPA